MASVLSFTEHGMCDENSLCARYYLLPKGSVKSLKHSTFETKTEDVSLSGERLSGASSEFELIKRVESLESKLMPIGVTPGPKMSASVATVFRDVAKSGCYSSMFKRVPSEYYLWDLSRRAKELGCGCRTNQLTKSMLMENVKHTGKATRTNSRFYLVVVQYVAAIDGKKLSESVRALPPVGERLGPKDFEFRVASEADNDSLTGFKHNSVSPFGLKTDVPIIISKAVVEEEVSFMWMGGGDVDLKLGMGVGEFVKAKDAFVLDISEKRAM